MGVERSSPTDSAFRLDADPAFARFAVDENACDSTTVLELLGETNGKIFHAALNCHRIIRSVLRRALRQRPGDCNRVVYEMTGQRRFDMLGEIVDFLQRNYSFRHAGDDSG